MKNANLGDRMTKNNNVYKNMKFLGLLSGRNLNNNINIKENNDNNIKENEHNNNTVISLQIPVIPPAQKESKEESKINDNTEETKEEEKDITSKGQRKPARKSLKFFSDKNKVTEEKKNYNENEEEEEMNFSYARPFEGRDILNKKKKSKDKEEKMNTKEIDEDNEDNEINEQNEDDIPDSNEKQEDTTEGYLYKIQGNKMKKIYFKLIHKDLYYYKSKDIKKHKGMHNLSGVYIKDEGVVTIKDKKLYCFNIIFPSKERKYYLQNEKEYLKWVESIRKVVHYSNLRDLYEIKGNLGKGKFGLVKLGEHKESGRQVAIKIINKEVIEGMELERIKSEIDILKIAKHPNIIKLYDVFENEKYI